MLHGLTPWSKPKELWDRNMILKVNSKIITVMNGDTD